MIRKLPLLIIALLVTHCLLSNSYPHYLFDNQRVAELQALVAEPGSVHSEIYAAIKARVDTGDWQTYAGSAGNNWNYHRATLAREAAMVYLISGDSAYAQLAFQQLWDVHNDPDPDNRIPEDGYGLSRAFMTVGFAQVYNWAYHGMTQEQRDYLLGKLNLALDAWVSFTHPNLNSSDRASNWVAVCRSAELIAIVATGQESVRASRFTLMINHLNQHIASGYGPLALSQEGAAYTGYAAHFLYQAVYALQHAGYNSLDFAWNQKNKAWAQVYLESFSADERTRETLTTAENRRMDFSVDGNQGDHTAKGWASLTFNGLRPEDRGVYRFWYDHALGIENQRRPAGDKYDPLWGGSVFALLYYDNETPSVNPDTLPGFPTYRFDHQHGRYFFRNRWQDKNDILIAFHGDFISHSGWDNADAFDLQIIANDRKYAGGTGKDIDNPAMRSGLLVDGRAMASSSNRGAPVFAEGSPLGGGYVIVDGGTKYSRLGLELARRHLKVDFSQPGHQAVVMTLDRLESNTSRTYTWQLNPAGDYGLSESGMTVTSALEGGRPSFTIRGNDANDGYLKGWVLSHPDALVVAGDPLQVSVASTRTRLIVAMLIGQGEAPVGFVTGGGAESVLDVAGLRMRWDPVTDRLQVSQTNGPIAQFSSSNDFGTPGTEVYFDGSASSDTDGGTIVAWHWDFGDGTAVTTATPTTTHVYSQTGNYTPILTVEDDSGLLHQAVGKVDIFDTISVNFGRAVHALHPNDSAGALSRGHWNQGPASYNLRSNTGGATLAALQSNVVRTFDRTPLTATPDALLMASGIEGTVDVSLLPDVYQQSGYEVLVYWTNTESTSEVAQIELVGSGSRFIRNNGSGWTGTHLESTATSAAEALDGATFVRFTGLTANRFTLVSHSGGISGLQIRAIGGSSPRPVNVGPVAIVSSTREVGQLPLMTVFDGSNSYDPDGRILSWDWNLGDGTTASGPVVSHRYNSVGNYTVTLTVMDNNGETSSTSLFVQAQSAVFENPLVQVNFQPIHVTTPDGYLADTGGVYSLKSNGWRYGWQSVSIGVLSFDNPGVNDPLYESAIPLRTFQYSNEWSIELPNGDYDVFLSLGGSNHSSTNNVRINELYLLDPDPGLEWDYDEFFATVSVTGGQLRIWPGDGSARSYLNFVRIRPAARIAPIAAFTASVTSGVAPTQIHFDASLSLDDKPLALYSWDFGDGTTLSGSNAVTPSHIFTTPGVYRVLLTVVDSDGASASYQKDIHISISGEPVAIIQSSASSGSPPLLVEFDGSRSFDTDGGSIRSWAWDFGNGVTANGRQVTHLFSEEGVFTVTLTVTDDSNKTATATRTIFISRGSAYGFSVVSLLGDGTGTGGVQGVEILSDGSIVMAANIGPSAQAWNALVPLAGAPATSDSGGVLIRLSPDGKTVLSAFRISAEVKDLSLDGNDRILVAAGNDGILCFENAETFAWQFAPANRHLHRVDAGRRNGMVTALSPSFPGNANLAAGGGTIFVLTPTGEELSQFSGIHNTLDVAFDEASGTVIIGGFRIYGNMYNITGNVDATNPANWILFPVHVSYLRGYDIAGNLKWENYNWDRDTVILPDGTMVNENPAPYLDPTIPEKTVDMLNPRWLNRWDNNMADTRCYRVAIGGDGLLYAAFEAAGGNHIFRYNPKDLSLRAEIAVGDMWHQFFNTGASHKAFVGRYVPENGNYLLGQQLNSVYEDGNGMLSANGLGTREGSIAADAAGRVYLGGESASGFPMPGAPRYAVKPGEVAVNPLPTDLYTGGAYFMVLSPDMTTRLYATRITGGRTHAVAGRVLQGMDQAAIAFGGRAASLRYDTVGLVRIQPINALQGTPSGTGNDGFFSVLGGTGGQVPDPVLVLDKTSGRLPLTIVADASGSTDVDGTVVSYAWNWTGSGSFVSGAATSTHTFNAAGDYRVSVQVTDNDGWVAQRSVWVSVFPPDGEPPFADAGADRDWVIDDSAFALVLLDGNGSYDRDGEIVQYRWLRNGVEIGQGAQREILLPVGTAEFVLQITDNDGHTRSDTVRHRIYPVGTIFTELVPEADTHVRFGLHAGTSYSTATQLEISGGSLDSRRQAFMRFVLDELPGNIIDGYLQVTSSETRNFQRTINLHYVAADDIDYAYLNANNAPIIGDYLLPMTQAPGQRSLSSASIADILMQEQIGDGVVSFGLLTQGTDLIRVASREALLQSERPRLRLALLAGDGIRPQAAFTATEIAGSRPLAVTFDASSSIDPNGTIVDWQWSFGDGATASGEVVNHTFLTAGNWTVTLRVTDDSGLIDESSMVIAVDNGEPTARFVHTVVSGRSVSFDGTGSTDVGEGFIVAWEWNFGDGAVAVGPLVSHTYASDGSWLARLTVTDNSGYKHSVTKTVTVNNGDPVAYFSATPTSGQQPLPVEFDGSGSVDYDGYIVSWHWDFGDGYTVSGPMVSHTFLEGGLQLVILTVTDNDGRTDSVSMEIPVLPQLKSINLNFEHPDPSEYALAPHEQAGVFGDVGWVNFNNRNPGGSVSFGMVNIPDNTGMPTGVDLVVPNSYYIDYSPASLAKSDTPDDKLMAGYFKLWNATGALVMTFNNIPEAYQQQGYEVIVYAGRGGHNDRPGVMGAHIDNEPSIWVRDGNWTWEGVYSESTATSTAELIDGPSYIHFRNLTGSSFSLTMHGPLRGSKLDGLAPNAVQIRMSKGLPVPALSIAQERPQQYELIDFDASGSTDNSAVRDYWWDFGDGTYGQGALVRHRYMEPGIYDIVLTVVDDLGQSSELSHRITVQSADGRRSIGLNFTNFELALDDTQWAGPWNRRYWNNVFTNFAGSWRDDAGLPVPLVITAQNGSVDYLSDGTTLETADHRLNKVSFGHYNQTPVYTLSNLPGFLTAEGWDLAVLFGGSRSDAGTMGVSMNEVVRFMQTADSIWDGFYFESTATTATNAQDGRNYVLFRGLGEGPVTFSLVQSSGVRRTITGLQLLARAPVINLTTGPLQGTAPLTVSFDASESYGQEPLLIEWMMGEETLSDQWTFSHTFDAPGVYQVFVRVSSEHHKAYAMREIRVYDAMVPKPRASFEYAMSGSTPPASVFFDASRSQYSPDAVFSWDFGDGNTANGLIAYHTYTGYGNYTARLHISSAGGDVTSSALISLPNPVFAPPTASFTQSTISGNAPQSVLFDASATSGPNIPMTYHWDFGDGSTGGGMKIVHTYETPGRYVVTLKVSNVGGFHSVSGTPIDVLPAFNHGDGRVVSVNFSGNLPLDANEVAGVVPRARWNNLGNGGPMVLADDSGVPTTIQITSSSQLYSSMDVNPRSGDAKLLSRMMGHYQNAVVNVTGVPTSFTTDGYDVIVYWASSSNHTGINNLTIADVNGSAIRYFRDSTGVWEGSYVESTAVTSAQVSGNSNYTVYRNRTAEDFSLTLVRNGTAHIAGIQLVAHDALLYPEIPVINVTVSGEPMAIGQTSLSFDASASRGSLLDPLVAFEWDLNGDGYIDATGPMVSGLFLTPGDTDVRLTAISQLGATAEWTLRVTVMADPDVSIGIDDNSNGYSVRLQTQGGVDYWMEFSSDLESGWTPMHGTYEAGDGDAWEWVVPSGLNQRMFFRIGAEPRRYP